MIRVFYADNAIVIDSIPASFVAGTLEARIVDGTVTIVRKGDDFPFVSRPWPDVAGQDGVPFASPDDLMGYLAAQLSLRRPVGETAGVATAAGADLAAGLPVAVSRSTGLLMPARADTYVLAFVAGLVASDTAQGFAAVPAHGAVTLADWTAATGRPALSQGAPYFLAPEGGLTASPFDRPSRCVARVGLAASPATLVVQPSDPILL